MAISLFNSIPFDLNECRLLDLFVMGIEIGKNFESYANEEKEFINILYKFYKRKDFHTKQCDIDIKEILLTSWELHEKPNYNLLLKILSKTRVDYNDCDNFLAVTIKSNIKSLFCDSDFLNFSKHKSLDRVSLVTPGFFTSLEFLNCTNFSSYKKHYARLKLKSTDDTDSIFNERCLSEQEIEIASALALSKYKLLTETTPSSGIKKKKIM